MAVSTAGRTLLEAVAADPQGTLLASDIDGTLAPIVPDPALAVVPEEARRALAGLDERLGTLAVITGRPVGRAREMIGAEGRTRLGHLVMLGQYGAERYEAATGRLEVPEPPASMASARRELQEAVDRVVDREPAVRGAMVEDKGSAVVLHIRRTGDRDLAWRLLAPVAEELADRLGLSVEEGRDVVELRAWQVTKADALRELMAERHPTVLVMCGDDLGDLSAMEVVDEWLAAGRPGARVVAWSPEQPRVADFADVLCDGPAGVSALLTEMASRIPEKF